MNSRTLIAVDTVERAHIIDVKTEEELEVRKLFSKKVFVKFLKFLGHRSRRLQIGLQH